MIDWQIIERLAACRRSLCDCERALEAGRLGEAEEQASNAEVYAAKLAQEISVGRADARKRKKA